MLKIHRLPIPSLLRNNYAHQNCRLLLPAFILLGIYTAHRQRASCSQVFSNAPRISGSDASMDVRRFQYYGYSKLCGPAYVLDVADRLLPTTLTSPGGCE